MKMIEAQKTLLEELSSPNSTGKISTSRFLSGGTLALLDVGFIDMEKVVHGGFIVSITPAGRKALEESE